MPALVATQHDPDIATFYQKLVDRGKTKMQAIVAVMRKLLHALHGMLRTGSDFVEETLCHPLLTFEGVSIALQRNALHLSSTIWLILMKLEKSRRQAKQEPFMNIPMWLAWSRPLRS